MRERQFRQACKNFHGRRVESAKLAWNWETPMTQPPKPLTAKTLAALKGRHDPKTETYARASPKVSRLKKAKVLTPEERAAFLASRPDLEKK